MNIKEYYALPTEEKRALMTKWRLVDKFSYNELGEQLGCTRNVIAGICNRFDIRIKDGELGQRSKEGKQKKTGVALSKVHKPIPNRVVNIEPRKPTPIPVAHQIWEALPGTLPIGILPVANGQCRWPIGYRPHTVCGLPTASGSSWCTTHHAIAFKPVPKENRRVRA